MVSNQDKIPTRASTFYLVWSYPTIDVAKIALSHGFLYTKRSLKRTVHKEDPFRPRNNNKLRMCPPPVPVGSCTHKCLRKHPILELKLPVAILTYSSRRAA